MRLNRNNVKNIIPAASFEVLWSHKIHLLNIREVIRILFFFASRCVPLSIRPLRRIILLIVDREGDLMFKRSNSYKMFNAPFCAYFWSFNFFRMDITVFSMSSATAFTGLFGALERERYHLSSPDLYLLSHLWTHWRDLPSLSVISTIAVPFKYNSIACYLSISSSFIFNDEVPKFQRTFLTICKRTTETNFKLECKWTHDILM